MQNLEKIEELVDKLLLAVRKDSERDLPDLKDVKEKISFLRTYTSYNNTFCDENYYASESELLHLLYDDGFLIPFEKINVKKFNIKNILDIKTDIICYLDFNINNSGAINFEDRLAFRFGIKTKKDLYEQIRLNKKYALIKNDRFNIKYILNIFSTYDFDDKNLNNELINLLKETYSRNAIFVVKENSEIKNQKNIKKCIKNTQKTLKKSKIKLKIIKI